MQAVIIAGGKGTRLSPLTYRVPKPMLPLIDRPFLTWMVERCRRSGITDILMNVHYQANQIQDYFGDGQRFGVRIRYVAETTPLDTAGAMKLAEPYFSGESLVVFNADILTDLDLPVLMEAHRRSGARATISLARVPDPTAFGLVELAGDPLGQTERSLVQSVCAFREKPTAAQAAEWGIDTINAGTYILEPDIFSAYEANQPLSFERRVFPDLLAQQQPMVGVVWEGYWLDLGTPAKYVQGQLDMLTGRMPFDMGAIAEEIAPQVWVDPSAKVDPQAKLAGPCYIGAQVFLGPQSQIPAGTIIGAHGLIDAPLQPGIYAAGTLVVS